MSLSWFVSVEYVRAPGENTQVPGNDTVSPVVPDSARESLLGFFNIDSYNNILLGVKHIIGVYAYLINQYSASPQPTPSVYSTPVLS